jgi:hypothetical protein
MPNAQLTIIARTSRSRAPQRLHVFVNPLRALFIACLSRGDIARRARAPAPLGP